MSNPESPIHWNEFNGCVQDHRDGTIDLVATERERAARGLPHWNQHLAEQRMKHIEIAITRDKELRKDLDVHLQRLKSLPKSRNRALAITHLEDSIMRLGMDLKELGKELSEAQGVPAASPYPNSYDPTNTKVDPTADGLRL